MTAGSSAAGPNPTSGSPLRGPAGGPRGSGAFMPVRPGRRTLQDENQGAPALHELCIPTFILIFHCIDTCICCLWISSPSLLLLLGSVLRLEIHHQRLVSILFAQFKLMLQWASWKHISLPHTLIAVPLGELGSLREEFQQLKAAVEVLTNATHLMAIPSANKPSSPPAAAAPTTSGNKLQTSCLQAAVHAIRS